jgi:hypothetical protein
VCIIEIRERVLFNPGIKPNCIGSIFLNILDFNSYSIMMFSGIFDNVEVKDIGLKFLLKSVMFLS